MQQSHYASSVLFRPVDASADRELEVRRRRAVAGRRASRLAFATYLREWGAFLFGSSARDGSSPSPVTRPAQRPHLVHG
jgi:hypothetical protein